MKLAIATEQADLLPRIATGDSAAVRECIERYGPMVHGMARRFFADAANVDDATQETFIDLWKSAGRYDASIAPESAFVVQIARRRMIDRLRRKRTSAVRLEDVGEPAGVEVSDDLEMSDEVARASKALERLPGEQRRVIDLSVSHGLSYNEIAQTLSLPLGTVKSHARRGLIRLRELLGLSD